MSLELIANEDGTVNFSNNAGPPDLVPPVSDPGFDPIKVATTFDVKTKAEGKKVATSSVTVTWTLATGGCPFTSATYDFVSGAGVLNPFLTKTKASKHLIRRLQNVIREGDASAAGCIGGWTLKVSPFTPVVCACDFEISSAGQTKVKAQ